MKRLVLLTLAGALLLGCANQQSTKSATLVPTVYADGTELVVLNLPAMT